jgi:hypothetical protein
MRGAHGGGMALQRGGLALHNTYNKMHTFTACLAEGTAVEGPASCEGGTACPAVVTVTAQPARGVARF